MRRYFWYLAWRSFRDNGLVVLAVLGLAYFIENRMTTAGQLQAGDLRPIIDGILVVFFLSLAPPNGAALAPISLQRDEWLLLFTLPTSRRLLWVIRVSAQLLGSLTIIAFATTIRPSIIASIPWNGALIALLIWLLFFSVGSLVTFLFKIRVLALGSSYIISLATLAELWVASLEPIRPPQASSSWLLGAIDSDFLNQEFWPILALPAIFLLFAISILTSTSALLFCRGESQFPQVRLRNRGIVTVSFIGTLLLSSSLPIHQYIHYYNPNTSWITAITISPDGKAIATVAHSRSRDTLLRIFDTQSGNLRRTFQRPNTLDIEWAGNDDFWTVEVIYPWWRRALLLSSPDFLIKRNSLTDELWSIKGRNLEYFHATSSGFALLQLWNSQEQAHVLEFLRKDKSETTRLGISFQDNDSHFPYGGLVGFSECGRLRRFTYWLITETDTEDIFHAAETADRWDFTSIPILSKAGVPELFMPALPFLLREYQPPAPPTKGRWAGYYLLSKDLCSLPKATGWIAVFIAVELDSSKANLYVFDRDSRRWSLLTSEVPTPTALANSGPLDPPTTQPKESEYIFIQPKWDWLTGPSDELHIDWSQGTIVFTHGTTDHQEVFLYDDTRRTSLKIMDTLTTERIDDVNFFSNVGLTHLAFSIETKSESRCRTNLWSYDQDRGLLTPLGTRICRELPGEDLLYIYPDGHRLTRDGLSFIRMESATGETLWKIGALDD